MSAALRDLARYGRCAVPVRALGRFAVVFLLGLLVAGCSRDVPISTVLESTRGLKPGDPVLLVDREVGVVRAIEPAGSAPGFVIWLDLLPESAPLVQANAIAYVPREGPPRVVLENPGEPERPVAPGVRLKGLEPGEVALWRFGEAVGTVAEEVDRLGEQVVEYFESEDWARKRARLESELEELADQSRQAAEQLGKEFEELLRALEKTGDRKTPGEKAPAEESPGGGAPERI